jgi:hypothetical protein
VSNTNLAYLCDYFERIKEQKNESYKRLLEEMSQFHEILVKCKDSYNHSYKEYCFEVFLDQKLNVRKKADKKDEKNKEKEFKEKLKQKLINYSEIEKRSNIISKVRFY